MSDKQKIRAEVERRIKSLESNIGYGIGVDSQIDAYESLLSFIDTLEIKEVDLDSYYHEFLEKEWFNNSHVRTVSEMMAFTAKHFFELGLKTQKGE